MEWGDGTLLLDVARLRSELIARRVRAVGIDGRGGSGKSTLARLLIDGWSDAAVVEMDDFYLPEEGRTLRPEVHGANFDRERLVREVLDPLSSGSAGRYRRYDWEEDRLAEWHDVRAGAVLLVEGVYSTSAPLRGYLDFAIWVDCPQDLRLQRGVERDGEGMRAVWAHEWMPAEDRYVEAERPDGRADLVLDGSAGAADGIAFAVIRASG